MEPEFPIEFVVYGTPVSHQRNNREARDEWRELIRTAAKPHLPDMHFATDRRLAITLFYYPQDQMTGDIDNIAKLILDAMSRYIYLDDAQVDRLVLQKFERGRVFAFEAPSEVLAICMLGVKPALYVRVSDDPYEDLRK